MNPLSNQRCGLLCVVSGPSGSGKTTLCRRFAESDQNTIYAVSATTRAPRPGEQYGVDYFFITRVEFERRADEGQFLEFAEVHGNLYGTLKEEVVSKLEQGRDVIVDIDIQGAELMRHNREGLIHDAMIDIFIFPPDEDELLDRLRHRGTENEEELIVRLENARDEMLHYREYQYLIISSSKEDDFATFASIIAGERCRTSRFTWSYP